jgi:hypothetical protein
VLRGGFPQFHSSKREGIIFPAAFSGPSILLSSMYWEILPRHRSAAYLLYAEVKMAGAISPLTYNVFMVWCVINQAKEDQQRTTKIQLTRIPKPLFTCSVLSGGQLL